MFAITPSPILARKKSARCQAFHDARVVRFDATKLLPEHMFNATLQDIERLCFGASDLLGFVNPNLRRSNFRRLEHVKLKCPNFVDFGMSGNVHLSWRDMGAPACTHVAPALQEIDTSLRRKVGSRWYEQTKQVTNKSTTKLRLNLAVIFNHNYFFRLSRWSLIRERFLRLVGMVNSLFSSTVHMGMGQILWPRGPQILFISNISHSAVGVSI